MAHLKKYINSETPFFVLHMVEPIDDGFGIHFNSLDLSAFRIQLFFWIEIFPSI